MKQSYKTHKKPLRIHATALKSLGAQRSSIKSCHKCHKLLNSSSGFSQVEPGKELEILTASSDNSMSVWDLRKLDEKGKRQPLATTVHSKTCQSAYFAPDGTSSFASLVGSEVACIVCHRLYSRLHTTFLQQ